MNPILEAITVTALSPHMHLRGKAMTILVAWPDGREEIILDVPAFDFMWQLHYELETPLAIPAGGKLISIARYDNSLKNRYNPAPDREVYWADQSWDEMFIPHMEYNHRQRGLEGGKSQLASPPRATGLTQVLEVYTIQKFAF